MQNSQDFFHRIPDFDPGIPPDLDRAMDDVADNPARAASQLLPAWTLKMGSTELDLQRTAAQFYQDNAGPIQSIASAVKPHLRGPLTPAIIILLSILISALASFILSIIQLAVLAVAVIYLAPSLLAASSPAGRGKNDRSKRGDNEKGPAKPALPMPPMAAAFAGLLAASYAVSSVAALVVLASSAYAYLNTSASSNTAANTGSSAAGPASRVGEHRHEQRQSVLHRVFSGERSAG